MTVRQLISSYPVHRAVVACLTFVAAILAARLLPAADFAALMTAAFMAKFLQLCNLGATNGYFVSRYSGQGPLAQTWPVPSAAIFCFSCCRCWRLGWWFLPLRCGGSHNTGSARLPSC